MDSCCDYLIYPSESETEDQTSCVYFTYKYDRKFIARMVYQRNVRYKYLKNANQVTIDDENDIDEKVYWFGKDNSKFEDYIIDAKCVLKKEEIIDDMEYAFERECFVGAFWTTSMLFLFLLKRRDYLKRKFNVDEDTAKNLRRFQMSFINKNHDILLLNVNDADPVYKEFKIREMFKPYLEIDRTYQIYKGGLERLSRSIVRNYIIKEIN